MRWLSTRKTSGEADFGRPFSVVAGPRLRVSPRVLRDTATSAWPPKSILANDHKIKGRQLIGTITGTNGKGNCVFWKPPCQLRDTMWSDSSRPYAGNAWTTRCFGPRPTWKRSCSLSNIIITSIERIPDAKGSRRRRATPIAHEQILVLIDGRCIVEAYTKRRLPPNFSNSPPTPDVRTI